MATTLCPACGEETLDQLTSCPICNKPLAEAKPVKDTNKTFTTYGAFALGGMIVATLCNSFGLTRTAICIGVIALASVVVLFFKLLANREVNQPTT